jgi:hypothetical protein
LLISVVQAIVSAPSRSAVYTHVAISAELKSEISLKPSVSHVYEKKKAIKTPLRNALAKGASLRPIPARANPSLATASTPELPQPDAHSQSSLPPAKMTFTGAALEAVAEVTFYGVV